MKQWEKLWVLQKVFESEKVKVNLMGRLLEKLRVTEMVSESVPELAQMKWLVQKTEKIHLDWMLVQMMDHQKVDLKVYMMAGKKVKKMVKMRAKL